MSAFLILQNSHSQAFIKKTVQESFLPCINKAPHEKHLQPKHFLLLLESVSNVRKLPFLTSRVKVENIHIQTYFLFKTIINKRGGLH